MIKKGFWGTTTNVTPVPPEGVLPFWRSLWQAVQHLLTASGANILGPVLMGISPSMALFTSGIATILYCAIVGVPAYLGTSFSFIATIMLLMKTGGPSVVAGGIIAAGATFVVLGVIVRFVGYKWIMRIFAPVVMAMVVIAIGGLLAPTAFSMASSDWLLAIITFVASVTIATKFKQGGVVSSLPVLLGVGFGYVVAIILGRVNFAPVVAAPLFAWPHFFVPVFTGQAVTMMIFVAALPLFMEHLGHLQATSSIVGQNFMPRMSKSLVWSGIGNMLSWAGTPSTTYAEDMGTMSITKVYSLRVMIMAGILAVLAGFVGKITPFIQSIPSGVLGGVMVYLFGLIGWAGFNMFETQHIETGKTSNKLIIAVMLSLTIAGIVVEFLRSILSGITAADLAASPKSIAAAIQSLQATVNGMQVGSFAVPALVLVALVGIVLHLYLDWKEIVTGPGEENQEVTIPAEVAAK
jgi:uracil permease